MQWLRDVWTMTGLCFKLLLHRRILWIVPVILGAVYAGLVSELTEESAEKSRIPVAVVSEDAGAEAEKFALWLSEQEVLSVKRLERSQAEEALEREKVSVVFLLENDYDEKLVRGKGSELLTVLYRKGEESGRVLSELAAGGILDSLCLRQSYRLYEELHDGREKDGAGETIPDGSGKGVDAGASWEEYQERAQKWKERESGGELITFRYGEVPENENLFGGEHSGGAIQGRKMSDRLTGVNGAGTERIYQQVIAGMIACFLMLLTVLLYGGGGEPGTPERSGTGSIGRSAAAAGSFLYQFMLVTGMGTVWILLLFRQAGVGEVSQILRAILYVAAFTAVTGGIFLAFREVTGSRAGFLVLAGTVFLLLSLAAFLRVTAAFLPEAAEKLIRLSPGGWFVERITLLLE